ncbi:alpha/beta fold hydrolase [Paeniroseomonas aquatica]|uniref:alpha/beta fold hydrolase n=1 Tax=Paeniroseomonas aquatica TaxID=373043 RepID=UPI00360FE785
MSDRPQWENDGRDWPNRAASRFVQAGGLRWHVQQAGEGPVLLLVHGTGAATHSWRGLLPLLARRFTVVAPDLPGHGFTTAPAGGRLSLPYMARALAALLAALGQRPELVAGHSAGAAILARMALDGAIAPAPSSASMPRCCPSRGWPGRSSRRSPGCSRGCPRCPGSSPAAPGTARWSNGCCATPARRWTPRGGALRPAGPPPRACGRGARHDGALGPASAAARPAPAGPAAGAAGRRRRPHRAARRCQAAARDAAGAPHRPAARPGPPGA